MSDPHGMQYGQIPAGPPLPVDYSVQPYPPGPPADPGLRPRTLSLAIVGMWIGAALVVVLAALGALFAEGLPAGSEAERAGRMIGLLVGLLLFGVMQLGLWIWMALAAAKAVAWARVVATVLGAIGIVMRLAFLVGDIVAITVDGVPDVMASHVVIEGTINAAFVVVAIAVLVLLWLPSTSAHYRAVAEAKRYRMAPS
ncbi:MULTISPECIES: hypothetical protein [Mycobacteriaceae]|uniref:Uncharacterized protein n=1 Tax=Mycolicibacterium mucogenicum TaxID=56689 RepID=A0A4R5WM46_MYCMU|nr:hypothetical protein [Mycolicibacterium mucogenicum]TDK91900.1 hypothetical protein EUA03_06645 [Mycolicibacterium mucogenicum]